jgi:hypothetical protein
MSKFTKPAPDQAALNQLVGKAQVHDTAPAETEGVRFTLPLAGPLVSRIDRARAAKGGMTRMAWIRAAIADALGEQGF